MRIEMQHIRKGQRRGSVLVVALWLMIALTAVVLVLGRGMLVEYLATKQHLSQAQADAAEMGAEQFAVSVLAEELQDPGYKDSINMNGMRIGGCYVWFLKHNTDNISGDESIPAYGLEDEASKIDLNSATANMLELLPNMDPNVAAAIVDWRDSNDTTTTTPLYGGQGAESDTYESLDPAYEAKNAPFESVEELRMVYGVTDDLLWEADLNHNNVIEPNEATNADPGLQINSDTMLGIMAYVTVYGVQATNTPATGSTNFTTTTTTSSGTSSTTTLVNVNSTSTQQLSAMLNQYLPSKAQQILQATQARVAPTGVTAGGGAAGGRGATPAAGGRGGTVTAGASRPFQNIWDWAVTMQQDTGMTSQDFSQIYPYVTCTTTTTTIGAGAGGGTGTTQVAKLNVLSASEQALMCIGFSQSDADAIINWRVNNIPSEDPTQWSDISWLMDVLPQTTLAMTQSAGSPTSPNWGGLVTGNSTVYSADIVTVSQDGRAFKRVKIVMDGSSGTPVIVYRRDLTDVGWPMDPAVRTAIRNAQDPTLLTATNSGTAPMNVAGR